MLLITPLCETCEALWKWCTSKRKLTLVRLGDHRGPDRTIRTRCTTVRTPILHILWQSLRLKKHNIQRIMEQWKMWKHSKWLGLWSSRALFGSPFSNRVSQHVPMGFNNHQSHGPESWLWLVCWAENMLQWDLRQGMNVRLIYHQQT